MSGASPSPLFCPPRRWLVALLLLVIAWTDLWSLKARHGGSSVDAFDHTLPELAVRLLPRQVRELAAGYLWLTADEYIHFGPSRANAGRFTAGAYAGNTEIIPVLEMALFFDPTRVDAFSILGRNLSLFLPRFREGIHLLQRGVFYNRDDPQLHELLTELAFNFGFVEDYRDGMRNNRAAGLKYLDAAILAFNRTNGGKVKTLSIWRPENIHAIRARWLLEVGKNKEAMEALKAAGLDQIPDLQLTKDVFRSLGRGDITSLLPSFRSPGEGDITSLLPSRSASASGTDKPSDKPSPEPGHSEKEKDDHDDHDGHEHHPRVSSGAYGVIFHSMGLAVIAGIMFFTSVCGFRRLSAKK